MVSYAKARAESLVPAGDVGFWERPERLVLMILGGLVNRVPLVLWILAIGTNITVIHRILRTWKQTLPVETSGQASAPARPGAMKDSVPSFFTHSAGR